MATTFNTGINIGRTGVVIGPPHPATQACCCPACQGLQCLDRTRFFAGQLLTEADLNNEQSYLLAKNRLHNRFLHGWGAVCGLQVVCSECPGWVTVKTGYAIDPCGNDIIVCADTPFNVVKAIQDCCNATQKPAANCSPLRYTPSPQCRDLVQKWCIAIQYQEQPSRMITPLVPTPSSGATCSCGCGCSNPCTNNGNGSMQKTKSNGNGCCSGSSMAAQTSTASATVPAGTCEPTRIVEGFQLCVVPPPPETERKTPDPGSLLYQLEQCGLGLLQLLMQAPDLSTVTDVQVAYQLTCSYLATVNKYFAQSSAITHCKILDDLAAIQVPPPANSTVATYVGIVAQIKLLVAYALLDCLCFALVPPCVPDPCDNRVILACVSVQDGKIVDICHFTGRKQLITLHDLHYWLGPLGLDNLLKFLDLALQRLCCGEIKDLGVFSFAGGQAAFQQESFTSAGVSSAAVINRVAAHYMAQTLGASALNVFAPGARAVDLRPLVGQPVETVNSTLTSQGFTQVTQQAVDEDPAWSDEAVAASASFAPAAVSAGQRLTVYTKGNMAAGFAVVDPTTAKLQDLQSQITALQNQMGGAGAQDRAPSPPPKKK